MENSSPGARGTARWLLGLLAVAAPVVPPDARASPRPAPFATYTHLWTDKHGATHQARCRLTRFTMKSVNPPDTPEWVNTFAAKPRKIAFVIQPPG